MRFEKGEYIMYGHNGICRVEDIIHPDIPGADKGGCIMCWCLWR